MITFATLLTAAVVAVVLLVLLLVGRRFGGETEPLAESHRWPTVAVP
jgi:hypothetical protein